MPTKPEPRTESWLHQLLRYCSLSLKAKRRQNRKPAPARHLKAWQCPPRNSGKTFYIVWDAMGDGRLVGMFSEKDHAEQIRLLNPHYYRYYQCQLNQPDHNALHWLEEPLRTSLKELCLQFEENRDNAYE